MITAWAVTTGEAGMRAQARGLAAAACETVIEKTIRLARPWRWLPPALVVNPLGRQEKGPDRLAPPWPDLLVTCGRRSVPISLAVRRASGGRTITVHVQDPLRSAADFDLVVALAHDPIPPASNVIKTLTAMHDLTPAGLAAAADAWRPRFAPLGRPLVGVAVGGPTRRSPFTGREARRLAHALGDLRKAGFALAITPSRRTPRSVREVLETAFAGDERVFVWNLEGDNPYRAILGAADRLVVTGDSVSMVSEAIATGLPVDVFDVGQGRHGRFLDVLIERGLAARLGEFPPGGRAAGRPDATAEAAEAVRRLLQARTGRSG
ncbi:MAG: mitochondrial fission ELM1 family protein [Caulobacteraceae bacterium]